MVPERARVNFLTCAARVSRRKTKHDVMVFHWYVRSQSSLRARGAVYESHLLRTVAKIYGCFGCNPPGGWRVAFACFAQMCARKIFPAVRSSSSSASFYAVCVSITIALRGEFICFRRVCVRICVHLSSGMFIFVSHPKLMLHMQSLPNVVLHTHHSVCVYFACICLQSKTCRWKRN